MPDYWVFNRRPSRAVLGLWFAALVIGLSFVAASASATVMKYAGLETLIEISDVIVHGEVVGQKVYFDEDQGRVVTDTTFSVTRAFAGKVDDTVTIQQWGGTYKGITNFIAGDAHFEEGEKVIVFLHRGKDGVLALSAMAQAKYTVVSTPQGKLVSRDFSDLSIVVDDPEAPKTDAGSMPPVKVPDSIVHLPKETRSFESFVAELEALVAGIKGADHE
jgi:hypothetical protein